MEMQRQNRKPIERGRTIHTLSDHKLDSAEKMFRIKEKLKKSSSADLLDLNDDAVVAVCQGCDEHAAHILRRSLELLLGSNAADRKSLLENDANDRITEHDEPTFAVRVSVAEYSNLNRRSLDATSGCALSIDFTELSLKRSPENHFQIFDCMFAFAKLSQLSHSPLAHAVLQYNTGLVHHRLALRFNRANDKTLAWHHYMCVFHFLKASYLHIADMKFNGFYASSLHTLNLLNLTTLNNLGHLHCFAGHVDYKAIAVVRQKMAHAFNHSDITRFTTEEYLFFSVPLCIGIGAPIAAAA